MASIYFYILLITLGANQTQEFISLKEVQWKHRVVLYFPISGSILEKPTPEDSLKIAERKVLYWILADSIKSNAGSLVKSSELEEIKKQYQVTRDSDFWLLIGLDGGVKAYQKNMLDWNVIFNTIDSMPMRQSEIKE